MPWCNQFDTCPDRTDDCVCPACFDHKHQGVDNPQDGCEAVSAGFELLDVPVGELKNHPEVLRMLRTISKLHGMVLGTENYHSEMVEARRILKDHQYI